MGCQMYTQEMMHHVTKVSHHAIFSRELPCGAGLASPLTSGDRVLLPAAGRKSTPSQIFYSPVLLQENILALVLWTPCADLPAITVCMASNLALLNKAQEGSKSALF